jgi:NADH-quinone oxidoreductase subunit N
MDTGSLDFARLAAPLASPTAPGARLFLHAGAAMLVVGIGFKLALVPFHMWTPDVYQGAPAPVTGFVATVSKAALVAVLLRLFAGVDPAGHPTLLWMFGLIAAASMVGGNLLALMQNQVKRILAYSSIAHMGYLLVAFLAGGTMAVEAVAFYLVSYTITTLGAFGVVCVLSRNDGDADSLSDFEGLFFMHPWLAGLLTATLLSLAGIPLTVGFMGKFYLVAAGLHRPLAWLVVILLISSGIGLLYYLRIVVAMFTRPDERRAASPLQPSIGLSGGVVLAAAAVLLVWLGIQPSALMTMVQQIAK